MNIKLTIIIPHYNYPDGLKRLLETIPDNSEIQVIVVDDKSTKDLDLYEKLKKEYSVKNVEFYDNTWDKGAGNCRNIGLSKAKGEWYLFADSDDMFLDGFYDVVKEYFDKEYDIVAFNPTSRFVDTGKIAKRHEYHLKYYNAYLLNPSVKNKNAALFHPRTPWSKLIRASLVKDNEIVFDNTRVANDVMFSTKTGVHAKEFTVDSRIIYCVSDREGSLTTNYDEKTLDIRIGVFIRRYKYLESHLEKKDFKNLHLSGLDYYLLALKYKQGLKRIHNLNKMFSKAKVKKIDLSELIKLFRISTLKKL